VLPAPDALLEAVAEALRREVGPAVADPFAKTQAFMAAVILEKLAGQLRADARAGEAVMNERLALVGGLEGACPERASSVRAALRDLEKDGSDAGWCALVEALYTDRKALGGAFEPLLGRVRVALRARLNRTLAFAS
jgi:hypothetical protein